MENFSRREFFEKLIPKSKKPSDIASPLEATHEVVERPILSRRSFIKFLGVMGTTVALGQIGAKTREAQEVGKDKDIKTQKIEGSAESERKANNIPDSTQKPEMKKEDKEDSYTETAIKQSLMMGARALANSIFEKLKIEHGNKSLSEEEIMEYLKKAPLELIIKGGVLYPPIEEALFRAFPSSFIDKSDKSHRWDIGVPMSVIFALAHNIGKDEFKKLKLMKSVPISQFMGGLFYWYLMREKGYSHAVLAHSINNTALFSIGALLFKIYPKEKAERIAKKMFGIKKENKVSGENLPLSSAKPSSSLETD